jgi:hypothetical protein
MKFDQKFSNYFSQILLDIGTFQKNLGKSHGIHHSVLSFTHFLSAVREFIWETRSDWENKKGQNGYGVNEEYGLSMIFS